jgi:hypothetical protein
MNIQIPFPQKGTINKVFHADIKGVVADGIMTFQAAGLGSNFGNTLYDGDGNSTLEVGLWRIIGIEIDGNIPNDLFRKCSWFLPSLASPIALHVFTNEGKQILDSGLRITKYSRWEWCSYFRNISRLTTLLANFTGSIEVDPELVQDFSDNVYLSVELQMQCTNNPDWIDAIERGSL